MRIKRKKTLANQELSQDLETSEENLRLLEKPKTALVSKNDIDFENSNKEQS